MIENLKNKVINNLRLISNFGYLSSLRLVTLLVPIITIPYLIATLGRETYGLVIFAQTIVSYFLILINFGFDVSASRLISIYRNNTNRVSDIVSHVLFIKCVFFILSTVILVLILHFTAYSAKDKSLFLFSMYIGLYDLVFPQWYFLGKEKMKTVAIINSLTKGVFMSFIFIIIKDEGDYIKVPIINGIGSVMSGFIALYIVFAIDKVKFKLPQKAKLIFYFKDSLPVFLGNIAGKLKIISNKAILGIFVDLDSVAVYDIAEKIKSLVISFLEIIGRVIFPNVAKSHNVKLVRTMIKIEFALGVLSYMAFCVIGFFIVQDYAPSYYPSVQIFYIIGITILFQPVSYTIGTSVLLVNNHKSLYVRNQYLTTILYFALLGACYAFSIINLTSVSIILVIVVLAGTFFNYQASVKCGLKKWII